MKLLDDPLAPLRALMTTREALKALRSRRGRRISRQRLWQLYKSKRIPGTMFGGKLYFHPADVESLRQRMMARHLNGGIIPLAEDVSPHPTMCSRCTQNVPEYSVEELSGDYWVNLQVCAECLLPSEEEL